MRGMLQRADNRRERILRELPGEAEHTMQGTCEGQAVGEGMMEQFTFDHKEPDIWERKHRRERAWHSAIGRNARKLAETDCEFVRYFGRGWVRCEALDYMYCLKDGHICKFRKSRNDNR